MRTFYRVLTPVMLAILVIALVSLSCSSQNNARIEERKALIRSAMLDAWNNGNLDALDQIYAPGFVYHHAPQPDIIGLNGYKKYISDNRSSYPDLQLTVEEIIIDGTTEVVRGRYRGTQKGPSPSLGIATGKAVDIPWCSVSQCSGDKIVESINHVGWLEFMQQVGYKMMPPLTEKTFARVTITDSTPGKIADMVELYTSSVVPAAKSQSGYCAVLLFSDLKTGKGISISIWDSEEAAKANEGSGYYKEQVGKFKDYFTSQPKREAYIMTVQE